MPRTSLIALCCALSLVPTARAASLVDPALRFRQRATEHFVIYFHQGEDALAARVATIAEDTWTHVSRALDLVPPPRTYVIVSDHTDTANGWATPLPYNLILITANAPPPADFIGNTTDWLRTVFTHEFAHIVHLDQSRGWARGLRRVFGRVPVAFPNLLLPTWQIEGLATYYEGMGRIEGRRHAPDFHEIERTLARSGEGLRLDRASGGLTRWPGAWGAYAAGLGFHQYLADRFGADRFGELARRSSGRFPFTASRSFTGVYGASLGTLWADYQKASASRAAGGGADVDLATRVTDDGYVALGPRFAPSPCAGCPQDIVYSHRTPHGFPSLMLVPQGGGTAHPLTTRYLGATAVVGPAVVVFDQQELYRNAGQYSDLFALDRASGRVRALTREARLSDPDMTLDGQRLAAIRQDRGRRDLIIAQLGRDLVPGPLEVIAGADAQYATPRWSPDGRFIAAERRRPGVASEIVVIEVGTGAVRVVARGATRAVTPAWRPDGRAIVAAVDVPDGPFTLYEFDVVGERDARPRRLTTRHAMWPDVSADGRVIAFVGMTERGFDLFTIAYAPAPGPESFGGQSEEQPHADQTAGSGGIARRDRRYDPWRRLTPTAWTPTIGGDRRFTRVGLTTGGFDPLGYHAYAASATWFVGGPYVGQPTRGEPDWAVSYAYARWRPRLFASASRSTSFLSAASGGDQAISVLRERSDELGVLVPFRKIRRTHRVLLSGRRETGRAHASDSIQDFSRVGIRAGWALSTAQTYGYSISPEHGVSLGLTAEAAGADAGAVGDGWTYKADGRAYLPGLSNHHVVALRVAGARSHGTRGIRRVFALGGAGRAADVLALGVDAVGLFRGLPGDRLSGSSIGVVNADYRWPLARPERGVGTWPILLHTIHASVFADLGNAWTGAFRATDVRTALGFELAANVVAAHLLHRAIPCRSR